MVILIKNCTFQNCILRKGLQLLHGSGNRNACFNLKKCIFHNKSIFEFEAQMEISVHAVSSNTNLTNDRSFYLNKTVVSIEIIF